MGWWLLGLGGGWGGWLMSDCGVEIDRWGWLGWLVGGGSDLRDLMGETTK